MQNMRVLELNSRVVAFTETPDLARDLVVTVKSQSIAFDTQLMFIPENKFLCVLFNHCNISVRAEEDFPLISIGQKRKTANN